MSASVEDIERAFRERERREIARVMAKLWALRETLLMCPDAHRPAHYFGSRWQAEGCSYCGTRVRLLRMGA